MFLKSLEVFICSWRLSDFQNLFGHDFNLSFTNIQKLIVACWIFIRLLSYIFVAFFVILTAYSNIFTTITDWSYT